MAVNRNLYKIKHKKTQIVAEVRFNSQNIECSHTPTRTTKKKYVSKMNVIRPQGRIIRIMRGAINRQVILKLNEYIGSITSEYEPLNYFRVSFLKLNPVS